MRNVQAITGDEIKSLRERLGWTRRRFAEATGVNLTAVCHWENGVRTPSGAAQILINQLQHLALCQPEKNAEKTR